MKKMIADFKISVDGFIEGPNGELDWVAEWSNDMDLLNQVDTCVLGGGMYPVYEQYWTAVQENPEGILAFTGRKPTKGEIDYAAFAYKTLHFVLSTTLEKAAWQNTNIVRDIEDIKNLKQQPGKDIYVVGGANLVSNLMNHGLIDELRLAIQPIVIGGGKALFKDVKGRHGLKLKDVKTLKSGEVRDRKSVV